MTNRAPYRSIAQLFAMSDEARRVWVENVADDIQADLKLSSFERLSDVLVCGPRTADVAIEDTETGTVTRQRLALSSGKWSFRKSLGTVMALTAAERFVIATA